MRKQDIRTGVVYAYQRGTYGSPGAVVFLSLELHKYVKHRQPGQPYWTPAAGFDKPRRGDWSFASVGYPVVIGREPGDLASLGAEVITTGLTPAQYEAGLSADTLTSLAAVKGPYAEVMAAYAREQEADRKRRQEKRERETARRDRAARVKADLEALGVFANYHQDRFELTLENAEKLAALLPDVEADQ